MFWLRPLVGGPLPFSAYCTLIFRAKVFFLAWEFLFGKTSPFILPMLIKAKVWASLDKYAGIEREASLADLVFAIYIEQRSKFAALMLLRMSRVSEIGENIFIQSDEIYKRSASLKTSPHEWSPLCEEKSTARRF